MVDSFRDSLRSAYRSRLLPLIRSAITPCFRIAVNTAAAVRLLPRMHTLVASQSQALLIVHLSSHLGDTVMLLPMIEALRREHPSARIECAVQVPMDSFLKLVPGIDRVYGFDIGDGPTSTPWLELKRTIAIVRIWDQTMRHANPGICIIPRWGCGFRDLMLAYLTQAPVRIGFAADDFNRPEATAGYRDALLTCAIRGAHGLHDPAKYLFLIEQANLVPRANLGMTDVQPNTSLLHVAATVDWPGLAARLGLDPQTCLAVIAPGASAPRRIWPIERWAAVIAGLHLHGLTAVLLTGKQDAEIARRLYQLVPAEHRRQTVLVAGATTLPETTCLLSHARLFLGNDSGPGHLAGALGVPCMVLFIAADGSDPDGPSAPERIRPMGQRIRCFRPALATPPCSGYCTADSAHCILAIRADDMLQAATSLVDGSNCGCVEQQATR